MKYLRNLEQFAVPYFFLIYHLDLYIQRKSNKRQ